MHPDFEVVEQQVRENDHFYARIQLHTGATPNDLLGYLIGRGGVQVYRFQEQIPSIGEIFIRCVRETMPETLAAEVV